VPLNLKGFRLLNTPKWSYGANASYEFPFASGKTTVRADYAYTGGKYEVIYLPSRSYIQPTNLVGAGLDWEPAGANWSVSLWARNLFDKHYLASLYELPTFGALGQYQRGRQFGATARVKW
jgi:iron complex outermembrane receptor protein